MNRTCGFPDTTTGHPCQNVIAGLHDHCSAGHVRVISRSVPTELKILGHAIAAALATETEDLMGTHTKSASPKEA